MAVKLLISGQSNSGKTTLTSTLEDVLVFSHDGKNYPFPKPHVNIANFDSSAELIGLMTQKMQAYEERFGHFPATVVIDSVSKVFDTLLDSCNKKHTGFKIYSELDREIREFTEFVEHQLIAGGINVILISHAIWDQDTAQYVLVGKGSFQKRGGFLAETDNSIFIETRNGKRYVHHRSTKFPARTVLDIVDSQPADDYSLKDHIAALSKLGDDVADFEF